VRQEARLDEREVVEAEAACWRRVLKEEQVLAVQVVQVVPVLAPAGVLE
jgi:hypothetical protein